MAYEMIHRQIEWLRPELLDFVSEIAGARDQKRDLPGFLERYISSRLDYDLVFQDDAENMIGILVGADQGSTVLLRSSLTCEDHCQSSDGYSSHVAGPVSQIFAGHALSKSGMFHQGTIVTACSMAPADLYEKGTCFLVENTLTRLNIDPEIMILAGKPLPIPSSISSVKDNRLKSSGDSLSGLEGILDYVKANDITIEVEHGNILTSDYDIPVIRCGANQDRLTGPPATPAGEDALVENTYVSAALLYRFLLNVSCSI